MGPEDVIRILNAIQAPYAMATPVVESVEDALDSAAIDEAQGRVAEVIAERERLMTAVSSLSFVDTVWPSAANFFLIRAGHIDAVIGNARNAGILLRDFGSSLPGCIRITVGTTSENDRLLELFASIDKGAS